MATFAFQPGIIERAKAFHRLNSDQELVALLKVSPSSLARAKTGKYVESVAAGLVKTLGLGYDAVLRVVDDENEAADAIPAPREQREVVGA